MLRCAVLRCAGLHLDALRSALPCCCAVLCCNVPHAQPGAAQSLQEWMRACLSPCISCKPRPPRHLHQQLTPALLSLHQPCSTATEARRACPSTHKLMQLKSSSMQPIDVVSLHTSAAVPQRRRGMRAAAVRPARQRHTPVRCGVAFVCLLLFLPFERLCLPSNGTQLSGAMWQQ